MFAFLAMLFFYGLCWFGGTYLAIWIVGEKASKRMRGWQRLLLSLVGGFLVYQFSLKVMAGIVDFIRLAAHS
jgi:hypothetical protein